MQVYVAHNGEQMGPFSEGEVIQLLKDKKLEISDYCYDYAKEDWVLLSDHPHIGEAVRNYFNSHQTQPKKAPPAEPKQAAPAASGDVEWYILKGENKFGPFTYPDVVRMLQEKSVFEFDYVWNQNLTTWQRIAELPDFSAEKIRGFRSTKAPAISEIFFRRRHARVSLESSIIIHDNKHVWKGKSMEVSEGGAGLIIENALLQPGQTLYLHFKPADGLPPFNAVCEVVSKQFVKGITAKNHPIRYGVKFTSISRQAQKSLADYTKSSINSAAA